MKSYLIIGMTGLLLLAACGDKNALSAKKEQMEKLKAQKSKLDDQMDALQAEIDKLDTAAAAAQKAKLVAIQPIAFSDFKHYIELHGIVDAEKISYIAPRGNPGVVKEIFVKQGDVVKKGQLLLKLDDAILRQSYIASQQNVEVLKTQLAYAQDMYQRQQNLWNQNIGTQVQLLNAKNNVATLQNQLKMAQENAGTAQEQLNTTNINSDVDGVVNIMSVKVGEIFSGSSQAGGIQVVNTSVLKATGTVPENYIENMTKGMSVMVKVPDIGKIYNTTVSFLSAAVDPAKRGYTVEARLPSDPALRPNQIALINIKDYEAPKTIVVPVATMQNDLTGKYIMVAVQENGKLIARRRPVTIGLLNDDQLEIKEGLKPGDVLITEGFQNLYDGQLITTQ